MESRNKFLIELNEKKEIVEQGISELISHYDGSEELLRSYTVLENGLKEIEKLRVMTIGIDRPLSELQEHKNEILQKIQMINGITDGIINGHHLPKKNPKSQGQTLFDMHATHEKKSTPTNRKQSKTEAGIAKLANYAQSFKKTRAGLFLDKVAQKITSSPIDRLTLLLADTKSVLLEVKMNDESKYMGKVRVCEALLAEKKRDLQTARPVTQKDWVNIEKEILRVGLEIKRNKLATTIKNAKLSASKQDGKSDEIIKTGNEFMMKKLIQFDQLLQTAKVTTATVPELITLANQLSKFQTEVDKALLHRESSKKSVSNP